MNGRTPKNTAMDMQAEEVDGKLGQYRPASDAALAVYGFGGQMKQ